MPGRPPRSAPGVVIPSLSNGRPRGSSKRARTLTTPSGSAWAPRILIARPGRTKLTKASSTWAAFVPGMLPPLGQGIYRLAPEITVHTTAALIRPNHFLALTQPIIEISVPCSGAITVPNRLFRTQTFELASDPTGFSESSSAGGFHARPCPIAKMHPPRARSWCTSDTRSHRGSSQGRTAPLRASSPISSASRCSSSRKAGCAIWISASARSRSVLPCR